jgi:hypothetical protein
MLVAVRTDADGTGRAGAVEYLRRDERGRPIDTQNRLLAFGGDTEIYRRDPRDNGEHSQFGTWGGGGFGGFFNGFGGGAGPQPAPRPQPQPSGRPNWGREFE